MNALIIILGATGDLTKKKLIPAIYHLIKNNKLKNFAIIGTARDDTDALSILNNSKKYIKDPDKKIINKIKNRFFYLKSDFYDNKKFCTLGPLVTQLENKFKLKKNRIIYLATLPQHFSIIANNLKKCNLQDAKVVFEKPFGDDFKSAVKINKSIKKVFKEDQIYRIDHYLGKELIQNISIIRFTNTIFEPLWNNKYIDHVQITLTEDFGVKERIDFYDRYGAVKDVVQNHMLQMLALTAMNQPKRLKGNFIRDEKIKILKKTKIVDYTLAQYEGYKKNSKTETFAAIKLEIDNSRWKGIPFYFITGKNLKEKITTIYIQFKNSACDLFQRCNIPSNHLRIQIQPKEGIHLHINTKGQSKDSVIPSRLDYCHSCSFPNTPKAYENLFFDIINGDQSVFIRTDEIEQQWKIVDKIKKNKIDFYKKGFLPKSAIKLIKNRKWDLEVE